MLTCGSGAESRSIAVIASPSFSRNSAVTLSIESSVDPTPTPSADSAYTVVCVCGSIDLRADAHAPADFGNGRQDHRARTVADRDFGGDGAVEPVSAARCIRASVSRTFRSLSTLT